MKTLLLILISTAAMAQGRSFPHWQEQAIVLDLIKGRECDSVNTHLNQKLYEMTQEVAAHEGIEIRLQKQINNYDDVIIPGLDAELVNQKKATEVYKAEAKKNRRQRNLVVALFVVVEVIRIATGHP